MEDDKKPIETPAPIENKDNQGDNQDPKTFTQEDLDRVAGERAKREREKLQKEFDKNLEAKLKEHERLAKLSAEEKEAELRKKQDAETADRLNQIVLRENRADARELLQEKNISTDLVGFVVDVDADKTKENIDQLEKAFLKAVEAGVNDKLKGQTPKDKSNNTAGPTYSGTTVI